MSILPKTKFGDCANPECGAKNTEVVKVGKETFCVFCRQAQKAKVQVQKANVRNQVRGLYGRQVESGNEDAASRQNLINDLDYVFSRIVRLRSADMYGNCECYTCGKKAHWSIMQCGHYAKRGNMGLRWNFDNAKVQDKGCNEHLGGNYEVFRQKMEDEQPGLANSLEIASKEVVKIGIDEMKQLLFDLRAKLRVLEAKFKASKPIINYKKQVL